MKLRYDPLALLFVVFVLRPVWWKRIGLVEGEESACANRPFTTVDIERE